MDIQIFETLLYEVIWSNNSLAEACTNTALINVSSNLYREPELSVKENEAIAWC